jgi:hypothetical protein
MSSIPSPNPVTQGVPTSFGTATASQLGIKLPTAKKSQLIIPAIVGFLVCVLAFGAGRLTAPSPAATGTNESVAAMIAALKPGDTMVLDDYEMSKAGIDKSATLTGPTSPVVASDEAWYNRMLSWAGLGGPEAASKHQGMTVDAQGKFVSQGARGYGLLEQTWSWIKSAFWLLAIIGLALFVLTLIPFTAPIAGRILRGIASIIPIVGSMTERLVASAKESKCGDKYELLVDALPARLTTEIGEGYTLNQKAQIKKVYEAA